MIDSVQKLLIELKERAPENSLPAMNTVVRINNRDVWKIIKGLEQLLKCPCNKPIFSNGDFPSKCKCGGSLEYDNFPQLSCHCTVCGEHIKLG